MIIPGDHNIDSKIQYNINTTSIHIDYNINIEAMWSNFGEFYNALLFNLARAQRVFTKNICCFGIFQFNCAISLLVDVSLEPLMA